MKSKFTSTKIITLGSCAFRQWRAAFNRPGAGDNSKRCSFIHGYQLTAKLWFECNHLDEKNWVVDFGGLKEVKDSFKNQFDHKTLLSKDDPLLPLFKEIHNQGGCDLRIMDDVGIEKSAEWCFNIANEIIKKQTNGRCWVDKVEVWEHAENSAIYEEASTIFYGANNI